MTGARGLLVPGAALLGLAATAVAAWSALLGGFAVTLVPLTVIAMPALAAPRPGRRAAGALCVWLLAAPLLAGVPVDQLAPAAWPALPARLVGGALQLAEPALAVPDGADPWPLAAALLLAGTAWIAAAALAPGHAAAAFAAGAAPWVAAALRDPAHTAVWQGAVVLLAGLLLHARPRTSARAAVALSVVVALASAIAAQAVAPRHRWFDVLGSHDHAATRFRVLQT
ncbi:MAG TPA: hypothetical protein VK631_13900, partial [Solirubrobacteraceae bacterium]|nr:hypothetical protein [Solirubrobacteraceae bacterium]